MCKKCNGREHNADHWHVGQIPDVITPEYFETHMGWKDDQDDLERANCRRDEEGAFGHTFCGWCHTCDKANSGHHCPFLSERLHDQLVREKKRSLYTHYGPDILDCWGCGFEDEGQCPYTCPLWRQRGNYDNPRILKLIREWECTCDGLGPSCTCANPALIGVVFDLPDKDK